MRELLRRRPSRPVTLRADNFALGCGKPIWPLRVISIRSTPQENAMAAKVKPVPEGFHTVTPYIVVDGAEKIIRFMKEAFGAEPVFEPMVRSDGKVMHAEFKIGNSIVM